MTSIIAQTSEFGVNSTFFIFQTINFLIVAAYFCLLAIAVVTVVRKGNGAEVPLWILTAFLVPIIGSIAALYYYKPKPKKSAELTTRSTESPSSLERADL